MKKKVIVEMDEELFENVKERAKQGYLGSDVWIAVSKGEYYKEGAWITNKEYIDKEFNGHYEGSCFNSPYNCSCCGYSPEDNRPNFCPNCGAMMLKGDK